MGKFSRTARLYIIYNFKAMDICHFNLLLNARTPVNFPNTFDLLFRPPGFVTKQKRQANGLPLTNVNNV